MQALCYISCTEQGTRVLGEHEAAPSCLCYKTAIHQASNIASYLVPNKLTGNFEEQALRLCAADANDLSSFYLADDKLSEANDRKMLRYKTTQCTLTPYLPEMT